jgi:branched-subunit amino acid aminotransferase/4-amino-4-deoxychorismate lyase
VIFSLLETMRVEPDGKILLLDRHLNRLRRSAQQFSFHCEIEQIRDAVLKRASSVEKLSWLRLTLDAQGQHAVESGALEIRNPRSVKLAPFRVNSDNPSLYHKTTNREIYDAARREGDAETEVLLVNERGEITEATIANVAVRRSAQWITPRSSCGLLNGVMRSELLDTGRVVEGIIFAEELKPGEIVRCFNALRGVFEVEFRSTQR